jgi:hypothetical protein
MIVTRRGFLKALGGAAIAVAAGEIIAPVARKIFLPPKGGWTPSALKFNSYASVHDPLVIRRCKQFVVASIYPHEMVRYDAAWTRTDTGEQEQFHLDGSNWSDAPDVMAWQDAHARTVLERIMRDRSGTPGSTHFKLELPRYLDARYV